MGNLSGLAGHEVHTAWRGKKTDPGLGGRWRWMPAEEAINQGEPSEAKPSLRQKREKSTPCQRHKNATLSAERQENRTGLGKLMKDRDGKAMNDLRSKKEGKFRCGTSLT